MKGFRFRFESLMRVRSRELDLRRRDLQLERGRLESAEAEGARVERAAREQESAEAASLAAGVGAPQLRALRGAAESRREAARRVQEHTAVCARGVAAAAQRMSEAWQSVRALEILHARERSAYRLEAARREQRELDEVAQRTRRKRGDG